MDVDGKRVIQGVLTVYPQVIPKLSPKLSPAFSFKNVVDKSYPQIVDNLLFRGKAWILYIVDCFSSLLYVVFITLN